MQAHPTRRRAICGSGRARLPNEEVGRGCGRRASGAQKNLSPYMVRPAVQEEIAVCLKEALRSYIRHRIEAALPALVP
jgi:hypothetical protein